MEPKRDTTLDWDTASCVLKEKARREGVLTLQLHKQLLSEAATALASTDSSLLPRRAGRPKLDIEEVECRHLGKRLQEVYARKRTMLGEEGFVAAKLPEQLAKVERAIKEQDIEMLGWFEKTQPWRTNFVPKDAV